MSLAYFHSFAITKDAEIIIVFYVILTVHIGHFDSYGQLAYYGHSTILHLYHNVGECWESAVKGQDSADLTGEKQYLIYLIVVLFFSFCEWG